MKNISYIFLLFIPIIGFSQGTPQGISYQAVAYDSEGFMKMENWRMPDYDDEGF